MKLNLRGRFVTAAHISDSIRATSSSAACRSASTFFSLLTLITSALAFHLELALTASSKTRLYSSIMYLSTSARRSASALTVLIIAALVVHGLYLVSNHSKI